MSEINRRNLVERFRDEYSAKFSTLVRERFATLVADAQVDVAANRQTVAEVKAMDSLSSVLGGRKSFCPHLADATVNTDPETFRNWDFDAAEPFFIEFCEKLFKDVYVALVPLMAAPPMVRPGTSEDGSGANAVNVAPWEYEVLLQHADAEKVSPPDCATRCILKARLLKREDGRSTLSVHADGFRAEERTECQTVRGNDNKFHNIDVPWLEYFPVDRTCTVRLREGRNPVDSFSRRAVELEIVE